LNTQTEKGSGLPKYTQHADMLAKQVTKVCGTCSTGAVGGTIITALWVRFQVIFLTRNKADVDRRIAEAKGKNSPKSDLE
jgi:hypothetical protein